MPPKKAGRGGNAKASGSRKRAVAKVESSDDDVSQPQQPPAKKRANGKANSKAAKSKDDSKSSVGTKQDSKTSIKPSFGSSSKESDTNIRKSSDIKIPLDENCPHVAHQVYIDDDANVIYDASLNQTNASHNNNKFYRLQLLRSPTGEYLTWTRWGRVGERGQSSTLGNGSLEDAIKHFNKKFKDKSGLTWENRLEKPLLNKYTFVEKSYAEDSDDEKEEVSAEIKLEEKYEIPESTLDPAVQELMGLIFNQQYFAAAMNDFNYDVNKLPLGKLSKNTILRGYQALKDLSALLDDTTLAQTLYGTSFAEAAEQLSNTFYSLIPHAFGRLNPPVILNNVALKKEVDLLDSLSDMKNAASIMKVDVSKDAERINALDQQFKGLNLDEMTPLKKESTEFVELKKYLMDTRGATHSANYVVKEIFRVERQGEKDRFDQSPFAKMPRDRRLLWHGSRCTNFGGILSQGLRIAPPEAPVSGYMFGKGIYLADMSSKSANYCASYISGGHALLLLCEAELGDPMQMLTNASYTAGEDAKANGMLSTWGQGLTGPSLWKDAQCVHPTLEGVKMPDTTVPPGDTKVNNAYLQYNEYIAYDVAQVRIRYLFRVKM